ncbi:HtaA domain-containing protein [Microbacterium sp. C5A9]|uniref:HtaA domain-containing protein n=1 Tax=Microbacterium sp. C5A9 TaxID=2736663 RepID=UPI001F5177DB|nr:HtaA domain-containing protein [Microbacterium sp. C5A9]MCI1017321.1 HtaA domain-containing protein [Microbacterium sp. C5A9]
MNTPRFDGRADLGFAWSVKDSFLQYIRSMPDGSIRWGDGASVTRDGQFYFPLTSVRQTPAGLDLQFGGEVRFVAHRGLLAVTLTNPLIRIVGTSGVLINGSDGARDDLCQIDLTAQTHDDDVLMWLDAHVALTAAGSDLFAGTYKIDEVMAPMTIRVPLAQDVSVSADILTSADV